MNSFYCVEVGNWADFYIFNGDPSSDIYNIEATFKNGIGYDARALKDNIKGTVRGPD